MNRLIKLNILLLFSLNLKAQVPSATIVAQSFTLCSGIPITFSTITTNSPTAYSWSVSSPNSVTITPNTTSPSITLTFPTGGVYQIQLNVSNSTTSSVVSQIISINQKAKASFNASLTNVGHPNQMILTNYSTGGISNVWKYSDVTTTDVLFNTSKNYTSSGTYSITLIEYGNAGCNDTLSYAFRISDSSGVTLPNIFTPNDDDVNDIFKPATIGISKLNAWIYNRYGIIIYSWDKPNGFWDGYTTSGELCAPGTYFCVIEAVGFDGKTYNLKGNITLFR